MKERGSPGALLFVGIGFWIVAYRLMPEPDWHPLSKLFVGFLAAVGAAAVIGAVKDSARRAGPWWQGLAGRLIVVGTAWLVIAGAASNYGTPHVLYEYPARQSVGKCVYFGWKGFVSTAPRGDGELNGCRAIEWF